MSSGGRREESRTTSGSGTRETDLRVNKIQAPVHISIHLSIHSSVLLSDDPSIDPPILFIYSGYFYSPSSSPLLLRNAPATAWIGVSRRSATRFVYLAARAVFEPTTL